jgi:hypothetical protein
MICFGSGEGTTRRQESPSGITIQPRSASSTSSVWALSFVIPSGAYRIDAETGGPVPGTYAEIATDKSFPHQFYKLWNAPTNGL